MRVERLSDDVTVYCGDALDCIDDLADGSIDCVITDPPYCAGGISESQRSAAKGQGLRSDNIRRFGWFVGDNMGTAGLIWLLRSTASECQRIVKPSGSLICFCDWRMLTALQPAIESSGLRYQNLIVWDKGSMGLGTGFRCQHELAMHFTFGAPKYHDMSVSNVLQSSRIGADAREHQTQKPVDLIDRLVRVTSPVGGVVADFFAGSGSVGVSAVRLRRGFVGCEKDAGHFETMLRRISAALNEQPLFAEQERESQPDLFERSA